jgi:hypothetical protein
MTKCFFDAENGHDEQYDGPVWPRGTVMVWLDDDYRSVVSYCGKTQLFGLVSLATPDMIVFARQDEITWEIGSWELVRAKVNQAHCVELRYRDEPIESLAHDLCMSIDSLVTYLRNKDLKEKI